jgi:signal transduction histidine kinase/ActR/RegA family two-component response regulator
VAAPAGRPPCDMAMWRRQTVMTNDLGGRRAGDPPGWLIVRRDGTVVSAEHRAAQLLGAPDPDALAGRDWSSLVADGQAQADIALAAIASGQPWDGPIRYSYAHDDVTLVTCVTASGRPDALTMVSVQEPAPPAYEPAASATPPHKAEPPPSPPAPAPPPAHPSRPDIASAASDAAEEHDPMPPSVATQRDLAALVAVHEALHDIADAAAAARATLQSLEGAVPFEWAAVLQVVGDPRTPSVEVVATYPSAMAGIARGHRWPLEGASEAEVVRSGEPSLDGVLRPGDEASPLRRLVGFGLGSRVTLPLYREASVSGLVILYRAGSRAFSARDALTAERVVRRLGQLLAVEILSLPSDPVTPPPATAAQPGQALAEDSASDPLPPPSAPAPADADASEAPAVPPQQAMLPLASLAESRLESLADLVAGVAHELNNPLTSILGYAQILSTLDDGERDRALRTIEDEAQRAARIVRNLLSFARKRPSAQEPLDIEGLIRRVVDVRRYALEVDNVRVIMRFGHVRPVLADEAQFEQVFLSLLSNAQQALEGRGGEVVISTWESADHVRVTFADNGPGVPGELRERIFEPFFTTREVGLGSGMGLAVVYGVVTNHGGRTWVEGGPQGGATFVIELPAPDAQAAGEAVASAHGQEGTVTSRGRRILVVDDEVSVRALTRELLLGAGFEVTVAESGVDALRILQDAAFDVVITDVRMPGMDGATLYYEILDRWPHLEDRVLFVTGDIEGEPGRTRLDPTAVHYLEKPFTMTQLFGAIEALLGNGGNGGNGSNGGRQHT